MRHALAVTTLLALSTQSLAQPTGAALPPPPEWAQGAVWYQVFPERFANAKSANDPSTPGTYTPAWTSDFYSTTPLETESAWAGAAAWDRQRRIHSTSSPIARVIPFRRYGGDLQGVAARLDHLQSLGVTAIYLCPVFQARSEHKYETSDHRHIDESLGNRGPARPVWSPDPLETADPATWRWTEADRFLVDVLIPEVHARGMRIVLDGVWNHVGREHWAFQDVMRNGRSSPYADWFRVRFDADGRVVSWTGWDRTNGDLPEFAQTREGDLVAPVKAHIFAVTRRWMDPNNDGDPSDGIDGWRLDVAPDVGIAFWRDWHALVKSINPEAVTIGEIWDPADRWIDAGCFDAQMGYPVAMALLDWLRGNEDSSWLARRVERLIGDASAHDRTNMCLMSSHDTERFASMLQNPGREYDAARGAVRGTVLASGEAYHAGRAAPETYDRVVLAFAILTALPGSPMLFQGDEFGMVGGDDPECRKPVPWPDLGPYDSPDDAPLVEMGERLGAWLRLRSDPDLSGLLRFGDLTLHDSGDPDVLVIERRFEGRRAVLVANRGDGAFDAGSMPALSGLSGVGAASTDGRSVPPRSAGLWVGR
ncbi:MAG: alpha-amylase family glycosyl hydrolase [Phycisphaerales bacterium]